MDHLEVFLQRILSANLKIKLSKCDFAKKETNILGHTVSAEDVGQNTEKIDRVKNAGVPKSNKELLCFLMFCSFYRRYVRSFPFIVEPPHKLIIKDVKYQCN